jgi:predicted ABC-type ATPase
MQKQPQVVILGGPNGAGKSTTAPQLLVGTLGVPEFVNADVIAQGLSGFSPEQVAIRAGRILLGRIHELADNRASFAFETTLASRSFAPLIVRLKQAGYSFRLCFLWLPNPEMAVDRVAERVRLGGHSVPAETIRRRYFSGIANFFELYQPLADEWSIFDNSVDAGPRRIASGGQNIATVVECGQVWNQLNQ